MRLFALLMLAVAGLAFADESGIMTARYDYVACDVGYTKDWLAMREGCAEEAGVQVFDSSNNVGELDSALADMKEAAEDGDRATFGVAVLKIAGESLELIGAVIKDSFDHKNAAFFSCVKEDEVPLKEDQGECRMDAISKEKDAVKDVFEAEIDAGQEMVADYQSKGLDTSGLEQNLDYGKELLDDVDQAYESGSNSEIRAIHHRHFRLVFLFRAEAVLSVVKYAIPLIEDSDNDNREEILEKADEVQEDIEDLIEMCEYSDDVSDEYEYVKKNAECWDDAVDILEEFNDIGDLIREGA
jgi:hypothetical protein